MYFKLLSTNRCILLIITLLSSRMSYAQQQNIELLQPYNKQMISYKLMTVKDSKISEDNSNIEITNNSGSDITLTGIYLSQWNFNSTSCENGETLSFDNTQVATMYTPVTVTTKVPTAIGSNYLYNLIMAAAMYTDIIYSAKNTPTEINCITLNATNSTAGMLNQPLTPLGSTKTIVITCNNERMTCQAKEPSTIDISSKAALVKPR